MKNHKRYYGAKSYRTVLSHYLNLIINDWSTLLEVGCGNGFLLSLLKGKKKTGVDLSEDLIETARDSYPEIEFHTGKARSLGGKREMDVILIADTLNQCDDAQEILEEVRELAGDETRLIITTYNTLWRPVLSVLALLGLKEKQPKMNWLAGSDVHNLLELSGWRTVKSEARILFPLQIPVWDLVFNKWLAPLLPCLCLVNITVARKRTSAASRPSVSIVIPARNESGNIADAVKRIPDLGCSMEYIFIEGNSTDDTWSAIQSVKRDHPDKNIQIAQQTGRGKGDAVRLGFSIASGDILMILDADLTMPPEDLPKFYRAIVDGHCEFANGCRLVYPMEEKAMQFLNLCANKLFGLIFSWLLGQNVKDTLCGTKVLTKKNYDMIALNREYFGDFDPFGDFDLLFGADKLNLEIRDIPVRYRERTYGATNISRFRHGILLFRMVAFAARKLKFV